LEQSLASDGTRKTNPQVSAGRPPEKIFKDNEYDDEVEDDASKEPFKEDGSSESSYYDEESGEDEMTEEQGSGSTPMKGRNRDKLAFPDKRQFVRAIEGIGKMSPRPSIDLQR
jgi:hypothetical protein